MPLQHAVESYETDKGDQGLPADPEPAETL